MQQWVRDLLDRLQKARIGTDVELHTDGPTDEWDVLGVRKELQASGDLGPATRSALENAGLRREFKADAN